MQAVRLRRLRKDANTRDWISQTQLCPGDCILPYFVVEGKGVKDPIKSMPGVYHLSIDNLLKDVAVVKEGGIEAILVFGTPESKDQLGSSGYKRNGVVQRAIRAIKKELEDLIVITDVCLCGYTSHGHCGIIRAKGKGQRAKGEGQRAKGNGQWAMGKEQRVFSSKLYALGSMLVDNDATLKILAKIALSHAEAGADFVAPSAMMDGQVGAIRSSLDESGLKDIGILAYSAKYASSFYGPFREALDSTPRFGDRKTYQMDYRNSDEALREIKQDIDEGADIVMVKPALAYLDIIYRAKEAFNIPIAAYNVSGEFAMVKAYCQRAESREQRAKGEKELALEILTSIKRAGADFIITYWAKDLLKWLK